MSVPDRVQSAIDAIRSSPVSGDENTMLLYIYDCASVGKHPNIKELGWDRQRAEIALVCLKVRGFIAAGVPS